MPKMKDKAWELRASTPFIIESADDVAEVFISGVKKRIYRPTKHRFEINPSITPQETDYIWPMKNAGAFKSRTYAAALEKTRVNIVAHEKRLKSKSQAWNDQSTQEKKNVLRGSGVKKSLFIYDSKTKLKNSRPKLLIWDTDHKTYIWDIENNNVQSTNLTSDKSKTRMRPEDWIARSRRNPEHPGKHIPHDYTGAKPKILIWDPKRQTYIWEEELIKEQSKKKDTSNKTKTKSKVTPGLTIPRPGSKCNSRNAPKRKLVPRSVLTPGHTAKRPVTPKTTKKTSFTPKSHSRSSQTPKPTMRNSITPKPPIKNPIRLRNSQNQKPTARGPITPKPSIKESVTSRPAMRNSSISKRITENPIVPRKTYSVHSKPAIQYSSIKPKPVIKNSPYKPIAKPVPCTKLFIRNLIMQPETRNTLTLRTMPKPSPYLKPGIRNPLKPAIRTSFNSNTVTRNSTVSKNTTYPKSNSKNSTYPKSDSKNSTYPKSNSKNSTYPKSDSKNSTYPKSDSKNSTYPKSDSKNSTYPKSNSKNSTYPKSDSKNSTYPKSDSKNSTYPKSDSKNSTYPKSESKNSTYPKSDTKNSTYPKSDSKNSTYPKSDSKNSTYPKSDLKNSTNPKSDLKNSTYPKSDLKNSTNPKSDLKNSTNPKSDLKNSTNPKSDSKSSANPKSDSKPSANPKPDLKPLANPKPDLKHLANPKSDSKHSGNPKSDSKHSGNPKSDSKNISPNPEMKTLIIPKLDLSELSQSKPEKTFPEPKEEPCYIYKFERKLSFNTLHMLKRILLAKSLARKVSYLKPKSLVSRDKLQGRGYIQKNFKAEEKIANKVRKSCRMSPRISSVQKPMLLQRKSRFIITASKPAANVGSKVQPKPPLLPKKTGPLQSSPISKIPPVPKIKPIPKITPAVKLNPVTKPSPIVKPKVIKPIPKIPPIPFMKPIQKFPHPIRLFPSFPSSNSNEDKKPNFGFGKKS